MSSRRGDQGSGNHGHSFRPIAASSPPASQTSNDPRSSGYPIMTASYGPTRDTSSAFHGPLGFRSSTSDWTARYTGNTSHRHPASASTAGYGAINPAGSTFRGHTSSASSTSSVAASHASYASSQLRGRSGHSLVPASSGSRSGMSINDMLNPPSGREDGPIISSELSSSKVTDRRRRPSTSPRRQVATSHSRSASRRRQPGRARRSSPQARKRTSMPSSEKVPARRPKGESRPAYSQEQFDFIWFQRMDLGKKSWPEVEIAYNKQFPDAVRKVSGLTCKYYRILYRSSIPKIREQEKGAEYGMWKTVHRRYSWMDPYADKLSGEFNCWLTAERYSEAH